MARQLGPLFFTGCMGDLCFYKLDGQYYVRMKSSLSSKRIKKDPRFRLTMLHAGLMGQASKIASAVYRSLPEDKRVHALYRSLTGRALRLLKEGWSVDDVKTRLQKDHQQAPPVKLRPVPVFVSTAKTVHTRCRRQELLNRELSVTDRGVVQVAAGSTRVRTRWRYRDVPGIFFP